MQSRYLTFITSFCITIIVIALLSPIAAQSKQGDTTHIRVFDNYLWTYYGSQNRWNVFPDTTHRYEKILMHFRLKCPTGGCGEWDYTNKVFIQHHTGRIDSSIQKAPNFRVDGAIKDSVPLSDTQTWTYTFNTTTKKVDTTANAPIKITLYNDPLDVWKATDTLDRWKAGYYNYAFNASGAKIDSFYVAADSVWRVTTQDVYVPFEVVLPFEIARFITPYGKWFAKDREFDWVYDVTDYAYLLRDSVEIRAVYDGYSQGSLFTLDFDLIEGIAPKDVYHVETLYAGAWGYGNPSNPIENYLVPKTVQIDPASTITTLKVTTTGHGFGGTENAAEFSDKTHSVNIDGTKRFTQHLWRDDCGQNPVYPQAGTWYYQRGGWCPGDVVRPDFYNLTPYVTPGQPVEIDYNMQPYTNEDLSHPATYIIETQVMFATGPNFQDNAEITEIKTPSTEFKYRRMNPICSFSNPEIQIKNNGGQPLTSLTIEYGVGGVLTNTYQWKGNLGFQQTADVTLPAIDLNSSVGGLTFSVSLSMPNGKDDEYPSDNSMSSSYTLPPTYYGRLVLTLVTDDLQDHPSTTNGIRYEVVDIAGNTMYSKGDFADRTTYRDTFNLADGCYQFIIYDEYFGDGLLAIQGTSGSYIIRDASNKVIIGAVSAPPNYLASFGDREITTFSMSTPAGVEDEATTGTKEARVYPNPTAGVFTVDLSRVDRTRPVSVGVYSMTGQQVMLRNVATSDPANLSLDLNNASPGVYLIKVDTGNSTWSQRVVVGR